MEKTNDKKKYTYLVIGSGKMGVAAAYDLLLDESTAGVTLCDRDPDALEKACALLNSPRVTPITADAGNVDTMSRIMVGHDCAIAAASYDFNLALTKAAIAARVHFCDLGGNVDVVDKQFMLDQAAKNAGIKVVPDCGIAPGSVSVIAQLCIDRLGGSADYVRIRVGGLPQEPVGPLKYAQVFSIRGLISNCKEPVEILRDGTLEVVESMTGLETQDFPAPFHTLEAVYTSGGSSTMAKTYAGKIRELDYKTLRFPGHWAIMRALRDLGFWDESLHGFGPGAAPVTPRLLTERLLAERLPVGVPDALVLRVIVGKDGGDEYTCDLIDLMDPATGHSAMQRTTAYSIAIVARMLIDGRIADTGTLYHERSIPPVAYFREWKTRGLNLLIRQTRNGKPNAQP